MSKPPPLGGEPGHPLPAGEATEEMRTCLERDGVESVPTVPPRLGAGRSPGSYSDGCLLSDAG